MTAKLQEEQAKTERLWTRLANEQSALMQVFLGKNVFTNDIGSGAIIASINSSPASRYKISEDTSVYSLAGLITEWYRLPAGLHSLEVRYRDEKHGYREIITTTGEGAIILSFEAGKTYRLEAIEEGNKIRFTLVETQDFRRLKY